MSKPSSSHLRWDYSNPERALTLPSRYFYDPALFDREKDRIFMGAWHLLGHRNELSRPGSFIVREIFDQSVVGACDRDGKVHAFHNVCQHRGNRLVTTTRGVQAGVFRCPYHSWSYGHDGSLKNAPRSDRLDGFCKADFAIPQVRVEEFAGFYYFNMDPNAPSMKSLFPEAEEKIYQVFPDLDSLHLVDETEVTVPANWKVIMDNSIEGYHFRLSGPCHVNLASLIDFTGYELAQHDKWWTYIGPPNMDVTEAYGQPLNRRPHERDCFFNVGLWPNNTFYQFPFSGLLGTFIMIPSGPDESILRFGYYSSHEGDALPAISQAAMAWMNTELGPEDITLNTTVQKGLHSLGYDQGRYMIDAQRSNESEHLVHHFHTLVYQSLWPEGTAPDAG